MAVWGLCVASAVLGVCSKVVRKSIAQVLTVINQDAEGQPAGGVLEEEVHAPGPEGQEDTRHPPAPHPRTGTPRAPPRPPSSPFRTMSWASEPGTHSHTGWSTKAAAWRTGLVPG